MSFSKGFLRPAQAVAQLFHPFPRLPQELRVAIWTHALPRGRVQFLPDGPDMSVRGLPAPVLARACWEARAVALAHATVCDLTYDPSDSDPDPHRRPRPPSTWFFGRRDVLFLSQCYPQQDIARDSKLGRNVAALCDAASTVALCEARGDRFGDAMCHDGFLANLVFAADRAAWFPALRKVLVVTDYCGPGLPLWSVVLRPGDGEGGAAPAPKYTTSKYNDGVRLVRPGEGSNGCDYDDNDDAVRATKDRFERTVLPGIEAKLLGFLRVQFAHEIRWGEDWARHPIDVHTSADGLGRDHPWVRQRWSRLPRFTQVIVVGDDEGKAEPGR